MCASSIDAITERAIGDVDQPPLLQTQWVYKVNPSRVEFFANTCIERVFVCGWKVFLKHDSIARRWAACEPSAAYQCSTVTLKLVHVFLLSRRLVAVGRGSV